jgi:hypothetical protein
VGALAGLHYNGRKLSNHGYPMKPMLLFALLAVLCAGCGQKGPLYLPPPEQESAEHE